jgi:hypothetical protein
MGGLHVSSNDPGSQIYDGVILVVSVADHIYLRFTNAKQATAFPAGPRPTAPEI